MQNSPTSSNDPRPVSGHSESPLEPDDCAIAEVSESVGLSVSSDAALIADGWVRRHLVDPQRAEESVELYESLGFEVKVQKLTPTDFGTKCQQCASTICGSYVMIYTRKREATDRPSL